MFKFNTDLILKGAGLVLALIILSTGLVKMYLGQSKVQDIADRCMSTSQVTINNVVFQCKPVGIKLDVTLPSGTDTVMYKKFQEASNEAQ